MFFSPKILKLGDTGFRGFGIKNVAGIPGFGFAIPSSQ